MDTKLRGNDDKLSKDKEKIIINLVVLILIVIISVGICLSYNLIKEMARREKSEINIFSHYNFIQMLEEDSYALYYQLENKKSEEDKTPSDILLKNDLSNEGEWEKVKNEVNSNIYSYGNRLLNGINNIEYYAFQKTVDKENDEQINVVNNNDELQILNSNDEDDELLKKLDDEYDFYIVMNYDSHGNLSIPKIKGTDKSEIYSNISNYTTHDGVDYVNYIKDTNFIYAIKDIDSTIANYYDLGNYYHYNYITIILCIASMFIVFCSLIIPYKFTKKLVGIKSIVKIPFEILFIGFTCIMSIFYLLGSQLAVNTMQGVLISIFQNFYANYTFNSIIIGTFNILWWMIGFYILFSFVTYTKFIFNTGLLTFIKEHTIVVKIFVGVKRIIEYVINNVDIREKNTKKLIIVVVIVVVINAIILSIMSMFRFFGVFGIIIYSIITFSFAKRYIDDINIKYNKLLKLTNSIADGNLSVKIDEDLGILNPLKEQVEKIKKGFKKAVEKEVKSEKMKTELVSNVSHDLKTPLTSIITYVDLLKDSTLDEEKKKQYLETLDRKSQSLQNLIEDLFEISKVNSENINLNLSKVDLVYLMKQTLLELDYKIKEADLRIKTSFNKDKIIYSLDSQKIFRVFENLIINITKYSLEGSRVYIDIYESDKDIEVTLKNIAKEEIKFNSKDIMERFVRGDKSRNAEGTGLGLAIAKSFIEVQGGTFNIVLDGDLFKVIIKFNK